MGLFDGTPLERPVVCERCGADVKDCRCPQLHPQSAGQQPAVEVAPADQRLQLALEKRKRGKVVTVISGVSGSAVQNKQLLKALKDDCGAGGSLEGNQIELQGDHRQRAGQLLLARGYRLN